jgi:parallel beta-helix repeat protein
VWLESAQGATIVNSSFINNVHDGVFMTGTTKADIVGNIFRGNGANGMSAVGSSSGVITGNTFDNTGFGIVISQRSTVEVSNNRIINNRGGIIVNNLATPTLRNNLIANSTESGLTILPDRAGNPVVDMGTPDKPGRNVFENNRVSDITNATRSPLIAVGNQIDAKKVVGQVELVASDVPITPPTTPSANQGLADVRGHWAEKQITALAQRNIIKGFNDGSFRPEEPVTRAQFAAILESAFPQMGTVRPAQAFVDVPESFWGHRAIAQAFAKGFMSGYPSGEFKPGDQIPRVQVLVSLVSGMKLSGGDPAKLKDTFKDASEIPSYALPAIATATQNRLVVNHPDPNQLAPNRPATRAEVAAMVYQLLVQRGLIK